MPWDQDLVELSFTAFKYERSPSNVKCNWNTSLKWSVSSIQYIHSFLLLKPHWTDYKWDEIRHGKEQ